jgi:hypothetical protein
MLVHGSPNASATSQTDSRLRQQAFERSGLGWNASANYVAGQSHSLLRV